MTHETSTLTQTSSAQSQPQIFLALADAALQTPIQQALDEADYAAAPFTGDEAAIERLRALPHALVIAQGEAALPLCQQLRQAQLKTPVLVIGDEALRDPAAACGAADLVTLPLRPLRLIRQIERALSKQAAAGMVSRYLTLFHNIPTGIIVTSAAGLIRVWNEAAARMYEWQAAEVLGESVTRILPFLDRPFTFETLEEVLAGRPFWMGETTQKSKNRRTLNIMLTIAPVRDETGRILEYLMLHRDITPQKRLEKTLQTSEEQMRSILDAMTEIVMILDRQGRFVQVPTRNSPLLPRPASELVGYSLQEMMPERASEIETLFERVLKEKRTQHLDYDLVTDTTSRRYSASFSPFADQQILMVAHDTTPHHQAERALQETATRYRQLFEYANDAIILVDVENNRILDANRQASRSLGYTREELVTLSLDDLDVTTAIGDSERPFLSLSGRMITEHSYKHRNGHHVPVESSTRVISVNGRPTLLTFSRDISERQSARSAEREQRQLAEALRDTAAALNSTLKLGELMERILNNISRIVQMESASIMLLHGLEARIVGHRGYPAHMREGLENRRYPLADMPTLLWMQEHRQPLLIADTRQHPLWSADPKLLTVMSYLGAPIMAGEAVIGFLNVDSSHASHFKPEQIEGIKTFAHQVSIALRNANLYDESQRYTEELETKVRQRTETLSVINEELLEQIQERRAIEKALQEERNLLRTLIDNLPDHVYVKDAERRFILTNIALTRFLSRAGTDSPIGLCGEDVYAPEQAALFAGEAGIMAASRPQTAEEVQVVTPNGSKVWLLISRIPLLDAHGAVVGIVGIERDITPMKIAEQKLFEERNLLRTLIDTIPDRIYLKDARLRLILSNLANARAAGYRLSEDILGQSDHDFMALEAADENAALETHILETGRPLVNHPIQFIAPDGTTVWELATRLPVYNAEGDVTGLIGVNRDITRLRQTEAQLEQVIASARCLLWFAVVEQQGEDFIWQFRIANEDAAQRFLPLNTQSGSYTEAWEQALLTEDRERRRYVFRTHIRYNRLTYSQEVRCREANGMIRWLVEDVMIRRETPGRWNMVGVCTDITERKKAEETLLRNKEDLERRVFERTEELVQANQTLRLEIQERKRAEESERQQRLVAEALRDSIAAINTSLDDRNAVLDQILSAIETVVPHSAASILLHEGDWARTVRQRGYGEPLPERLPIRDMPYFQSVLATRQPHIMGDSRTFEGWLNLAETNWVRSSLTIPIQLDQIVIGFISLESGTPHRFTEEDARLLQSFSEQASIAIHNSRLMEAVRGYASELEVRVDQRTFELRIERAQMRAILDSMREGVIFYDLHYFAHYVNQALLEITGYNEDEWRAGIIAHMMSNMAVDQPQRLVRKIGRALRRRSAWQGEVELRRKDGTVYSTAISTAEVRTPDHQRIGILVVVRDISQDKALEAQKKRFIADAAHELRTPIANLKVRLFLMSRQPERLPEHMEIAMKAADWMQSLIDNLFDMARFERGTILLKRETMALQTFLHDVVRFQEPEADRRGLHFIYEFPDQPVMVSIDPYRLAQVITNLVVNALNHTAEGAVTITAWMEGEGVCVRVRDTGTGISPEHLPHLFEPFYRARSDDNRGTGLGLSISHEIVQLHGGTIQVDSEVGRGSDFTVFLPVLAT